MTFLIDAKKRGVLRQAGAVYQFRHISLQQRLSARHRRWSRRLVSAAARGIRRYEGPLPLSLRYWWLHSSAQWPELWALRFEEAARTKSWLGAPAGKVHREGPGCYQSFDGVGGDHAWVICALPGQPPMVVGKPVWEALRQAGIGAPGDALAAVGFPVAEYDYTGLGRVVPADATRIELGGGSWGPGLLVRDDGCDDWGWQSAKTRFFLTTRAGWQGTRFFLPRLAGSQLPQLRVRAEATIPWAISGLAITPQALQEMADTLAFSDLTRAVTELSARRGSVLPTASWQESVTGRSIDRRSLAYVVTAPDGRPVMTAEVIVSLPSSGHSDLVTIAELRVEDFEAWPDALNAAGGTLLDESQLRLSPDELLGFLAAAWHTVAEVLPALVVEHPGVEHPGAVPFASPPVSELLLAAEARHNQTVSRRDLRDLVDFSSLIIGDGRQLPMVSVQITGPLRLSREDRQMRTREVLTYMARGVGLNNPRGGWQLPGWTELSNIDLKEPRSDS